MAVKCTMTAGAVALQLLGEEQRLHKMPPKGVMTLEQANAELEQLRTCLKSLSSQGRPDAFPSPDYAHPDE